MPRAKQKLTRSAKKSTESKATKESVVSEVKDTEETKKTKVATEKDKKAPAKKQSRVYREKTEVDPELIGQIKAELTEEIKKQVEFELSKKMHVDEAKVKTEAKVEKSQVVLSGVKTYTMSTDHQLYSVCICCQQQMIAGGL